MSRTPSERSPYSCFVAYGRGTVNKQNFRYWSHNNPRELQRPLHSLKVIVWYAIFEFGAWSPYIFEEDDVPPIGIVQC
jgi:hypothetical protein